MTEITPYFSLVHSAWVPAVLLWDRSTGELQRLEGAEGFADYRAAAEASRFLVPAHRVP